MRLSTARTIQRTAVVHTRMLPSLLLAFAEIAPFTDRVFAQVAVVETSAGMAWVL